MGCFFLSRIFVFGVCSSLFFLLIPSVLFRLLSVYLSCFADSPYLFLLVSLVMLLTFYNIPGIFLLVGVSEVIHTQITDHLGTGVQSGK